MQTFLQDLRYGCRMLLRSSAVTVVALLALALGIGANTALFSVVYAVLLRPLPVRDSGRLVSIQSFNSKFNIPPISPAYAVYGLWKKNASCFDGMAASWAGTAEIGGDRAAEKVPYWRVTASFLSVLGVQPLLGRPFTADEDQPGAPRVALLSYDLWQRRFAGDASITAKALRLNDEVFTIVGVMPKDFHIDGKPADVYAPIARNPADKSYLPVTAYGRLKAGVSLAQAQSEMDAVARRLDERGSGWKAKVWSLRDSMAHDVRLSLLVLLGAVGLVLLLACANVASLLLARSAARRREVAIRAALGAPRSRLLRQFLTESLLLGGLGGILGLLLAFWSMRLVPLLEHARLPNLLLATRVDAAVLAFAAMLSMATGVIFGIVPALFSTGMPDSGRVTEGRRPKRLWNALVISETALALILLIGATLLIRSFFYLRDTAPGFRVDGLLTATLNPPRARYSTPEQLMAYYGQVLEKVRAVAGVRAATMASTLPLDGFYASMSMQLEGVTFARPQDWPILWHRTIAPDYFRTLEIPLRKGRLFTEQDGPGAPRVVIINETMARRFWPAGDALGKHLGKQFEIIGIVADVRHQDATREGLTEIFFPMRQGPPPSASLAVRADRRALAAISKTVAAVDAGVPLQNIREMTQINADRLATKRLTSNLIAVFAGLALVLAAIGIYGVLSFTAAQRTHEIGVRMALGAARGAVLRLIVSQAAGLAMAGIGVGLLGALALTRVLKSLLYGVSATDPAVYAGVSVSLLAVAALAAYIPARRASRTDPMAALRDE